MRHVDAKVDDLRHGVDASKSWRLSDPPSPRQGSWNPQIAPLAPPRPVMRLLDQNDAIDALWKSRQQLVEELTDDFHQLPRARQSQGRRASRKLPCEQQHGQTIITVSLKAKSGPILIVALVVLIAIALLPQLPVTALRFRCLLWLRLALLAAEH